MSKKISIKASKKHIYLASLLCAVGIVGGMTYQWTNENAETALAATVPITCSGQTITQGVDFNNDDDLVLTGNGTCVLSGAATLNSLVVGTVGGDVTVLTHAQGDNTGVNVQTDENITIYDGASIDVDGKGCQNNEAPDVPGGTCTNGATGAGAYLGFNVGGGGYGGNGAGANDAGWGNEFGSPTEPISLGGGGGGSGGDVGGIGGGYIRLNATGTVVLDGDITADGSSGISGSGGSGGGIYITAGTLQNSGGTPTITADGGPATSDGFRGEGGGGRIAVYFNSAVLTQADTIADNTHASKGSPHAANLVVAQDGSTLIVYDPSADSTPVQDGYANISDDTIRIHDGFTFDQSSPSTLAIAPNVLEISNAENVSTTSNVTALTFTYGVSGDSLATPLLQNATLDCDAASSLILNSSSSGIPTDTLTRVSGNTITCSTMEYNFTGYDTVTIDDTVTVSDNGLGAITIDSDSGSSDLVTLSGAVFTVPNDVSDDDQTIKINTIGNLSLESNASITGNLNEPAIVNLNVESGSSLNGNVILTGLTGTSTIAGTIDASGSGCQGGDTSLAVDNSPGFGVDAIGGTCVRGGLGHGSTQAFDVGGGAYGGNGGGLSAARIGVAFGEKNNPNSYGAGAGGTGPSDVGGSGGGIVRLISDLSTGVVDITGTIRSDGAQGQALSGGSGGAIYVRAAQITGNGTVIAQGGTGNPSDRAAGGGGRIALAYAVSSSFSGSITAPGGTGNRVGAAGFGGSGLIHYLNNAPNTFTSSISDGIFDDSDVTFYDSNGDPRVEITLDIASNGADIDMSPLFISATTTKTLSKNHNLIDGAQATKNLYVPYNNALGVYVCPDATAIDDVQEGVCTNEVLFEPNEVEFSDNDPAVTKTVGGVAGVYVQVVDSNDVLVAQGSAGAGDFYKIIGLGQTGAGEQSAGDGTLVSQGGGGSIQQGTISFDNGSLVFDNVPDSTTFSVITALSVDQDSFNNSAGSDSTDTVQVTDATGLSTSGFTIQLSASDFTNGNGDTISKDNIYVVTTSGTGDASVSTVRSGGSGANDGTAQYNVASSPTDPETLLGDSGTFTTYGVNLTNPVNIMVTDNNANIGTFAQNVSFYILVPAFTPPGSYSGEFTYTLIQN